MIDLAHFVVDCFVYGDPSFADLGETTSNSKRNGVLPLVDSRDASSVTQGPGYALTATKKGFGICDKHRSAAYSILESNFKDAGGGGLYALSPMETMGQRIKRMREQRGWTQGQLAEMVGVTVSAVSQWELDQTENVKLLPFLRLAKLFETDAHYLVFGSGRGAVELSKPVQVSKKRPKG